MYPVAKQGVDLPPAFGKLIQPDRAILTDPETVRAHRDAWVDEWLNALAP